MDHDQYLAALAQNVRDLIGEAELLFNHKRWARAGGLAMYAIEQAQKYDAEKADPETPWQLDHSEAGGVFKHYMQDVFASSMATDRIVVLYVDEEHERLSELWAKSERANIFRQALFDVGEPVRAVIPPHLREMHKQRGRSFYVNRHMPGPSSFTEEQARDWIEQAKKLSRTVKIYPAADA